MTHLNIQQGLNVEVVSTLIIKKLYDAAQSVPLPEEGEQDLANMSGNLLVDKTYRSQVSYLTTRFSDLHINVTDTYYIPFEDPNVQSVLMANNISSDGIGITEVDAATANLGTMFKENTTITSFNGFGYFNRANTSPVNGMFNNCTNLSSIDFSNTTSIAETLFHNTALTTISIPNLQNLSGIDQFSTCANLTEVLNLGSITSLPRGTFWNCPLLTDVVLPESCTSIGLATFGNSPLLLNINLQNVTSIGQSCFSGCSSLNITDLRNVTSIGREAFSGCTGLQGEMDLRNVVSIDQSAFQGTNISGILNLPKLQTLNGNYIFRGTKISGVECLGKANNLIGTFRDCSNLLYAKIPYECTTLDYDVFEYCNNLTSVKQYTDSIDNWVEGEEPTTGPLSRVTSFGQNCFLNCSLLLLTLLDIQNATTIGLGAFRNTLFSGPIDLSGVSSIGNEAFRDTYITSVILPSSITALPYGLFFDCENLTNISGVENVTSIGDYTFAYVYGLTGVYNFANLTSVGRLGLTGTVDISLYIPKMQYVGNGGDGTNYTYANVSIGGAYHGRNATFNIIYLRDVIMFYGEAFVRSTIHHLVINNTTPPDWKPGPTSDVESGLIPAVFAFCTVDNIYVPDTAVSSYTAHLYWGTLSNKIHPISDLNKVATKVLWEALPAADKPNTLIEEYM